MNQALLRGESWTLRGPDQTLAGWLARVPANDPEPDGVPEGCDHYESWVSGGEITAVCTKCGDATPENCESAHNAAVEFFKQQFPEDE